MLPSVFKSVRRGSTNLFSAWLLCVLICVQVMPCIAQTTSFGTFKAVFEKPCNQTMDLKIPLLNMTQFTVCTFINLKSTDPWTAFIYKLPMSPSNKYELGLLGDSGLMKIWMFDTQITINKTLNINTWYRTCIFWYGNNNSMAFYVNGDLTETKILNATQLTGGGTLSLGCSQEINSSLSLGLVGELYMFGMWNRTDNALLGVCIDGNVVPWNTSYWSYNSSVVQMDNSLSCANKENFLEQAVGGSTTTHSVSLTTNINSLVPGNGNSSNTKLTTAKNTDSSNTPETTLSSSTYTSNATVDNQCDLNNNSSPGLFCNLSSKCNYSGDIYAVTLQENEDVCIQLENLFIQASETSTNSSLNISTAVTSAYTIGPQTSPSETSTVLPLNMSTTLISQTTENVQTVNTSFSEISTPTTGNFLPNVNTMSNPTTLASGNSSKSCTLIVENSRGVCDIQKQIRDRNDTYKILEIKKIGCCCFDNCPENITSFHSLTCNYSANYTAVNCSGGNPGSGSATSSITTSSISYFSKTTQTIAFTNISTLYTTNIQTTSTALDFKRLNDILTSGNLNSSIVDKVVSDIENMLSGEVSPETATQLVGVLNNFLNISQDLITPVAKRLIRIVDSMGIKLTFPGSSINITSNALAIAVNKINATVFSKTSFGVVSSSGLQVSLGSEEPLNRDGTIILPASLLNGFSSAEKVDISRIQFNFFENTAFFKDSSLSERNLSLVSKVISSSVGNLSITNLTENVTVALKINGLENHTVKCVFWDFNGNNGQGGWESSGCFVDNTTQNETVCKCNHLTSFAILMDVYQTVLNPTDTVILTFITYIGCGISAIFLSVTLVTYIAFEKIRRDYPSKILIQLCAALIGLNLAFLLSPWIALYNNIPGLCIAAAAFLHYFLIVSITWMGLEAFHMYFSLVKVFNTYVRKYMLKFCVIGWGCPAIVVAIILAVNKDLYGLQSHGTFPDGSPDEMCWIKDIIFYITVVGYFGIIFLLNVSMFIVVLIQLCRIKKQKQLGYQRKTTFQDLRSVTGITFLLGITWGLAFFSFGPGKIAILYLFTILNSLQGFFIFIFYCVAKENVRKQWRRYLCCGKLRLAENSDWSKTATNKLKNQTSKQGASSSSSNSIQSNSNSNSTTLLVGNEYFVHPNGNGNVFKERNGVSIMVQNGEVPLHDISMRHSNWNGNPQNASIRRTSNRGSVHFMDQS
ncbi:adhesion G- coupled receptor G2 [Pelobates cultripes]|uniref:Adhesion G-protein coupled receptor G2 n=3 Tax=Pelobates cultripes TaxID=61616 RepID=A0AAD1VJ01_PELCU|nr:adhesion G- coupled receptor G2 [Pelobates cultripes]